MDVEKPTFVGFVSMISQQTLIMVKISKPLSHHQQFLLEGPTSL